MQALRILTDFGDLAVLLPLLLVIFIWLLSARTKAAALWWVVAAAICMAGTALLKIYFEICSPPIDLRSPSGHASLSTLVYGALALVVATAGKREQRLAAWAVGGALILGIALSRVWLQIHNWHEAASGLAVGVAALSLFAKAYRAHPPAATSWQPLILAVAVLVLMLHGQRLHAEELLQAIGAYLRTGPAVCG